MNRTRTSGRSGWIEYFGFIAACLLVLGSM
jgi:hypothetical protein